MTLFVQEDEGGGLTALLLGDVCQSFQTDWCYSNMTFFLKAGQAEEEEDFGWIPPGATREPADYSGGESDDGGEEGEEEGGEELKTSSSPQVAKVQTTNGASSLKRLREAEDEGEPSAKKVKV